jgi:hypothetical protein
MRTPSNKILLNDSNNSTMFLSVYLQFAYLKEKFSDSPSSSKVLKNIPAGRHHSEMVCRRTALLSDSLTAIGISRKSRPAAGHRNFDHRHHSPLKKQANQQTETMISPWIL